MFFYNFPGSVTDSKSVATQRTFFEDMSTFFLHDILRALQILLTVRLSGYV